MLTEARALWGRRSIEYLVMFPQAVPRLVFGLALLWAWLNIPIPIYGTLWLLALAYFTVMLPLGVRTLAGVVLQIDKSLEECAPRLRRGLGVPGRAVLGLHRVQGQGRATAAHKAHGKESEVAIRTAYIDLEARPGDNHVPGTVRQRLFHGDFVQYVIDSALGSLSVRRPPVNLLDEGVAVTLSFSPEHCVLLEA